MLSLTLYKDSIKRKKIVIAFNNLCIVCDFHEILLSRDVLLRCISVAYLNIMTRLSKYSEVDGRLFRTTLI